MNLKNRIVAVVAVAALAVPALAYAKYSKGSGAASITVKGEAPAVKFKMTLTDVSVTDDGTTTTVEFDGNKFKDVDKSETREKHMRENVFPGAKGKWQIIVKNADIEPALKSGSLPAKVKSAWTIVKEKDGKPKLDKDGKTTPFPASITITDFKRSSSGKDFVASGTIKTTLGNLGVEKVCVMGGTICVKDSIEISASIPVKE